MNNRHPSLQMEFELFLHVLVILEFFLFTYALFKLHTNTELHKCHIPRLYCISVVLMQRCISGILMLHCQCGILMLHGRSGKPMLHCINGGQMLRCISGVTTLHSTSGLPKLLTSVPSIHFKNSFVKSLPGSNDAN